jgi:hypothetical protein
MVYPGRVICKVVNAPAESSSKSKSTGTAWADGAVAKAKEQRMTATDAKLTELIGGVIPYVNNTCE